ncbi:MAG: leucyl/phenylalanyl-tRNA--protein transferase [Pigmentiphaga sp.]|nr:leucyl/phenylalanyl-tRNA--protein transferase [Pigmentiphaga sp.]
MSEQPAWLMPGEPFPPLDQAMTEPDGLLAISLDLSTARLEAAYRQGVFPWYSEGQPVLWWSPDPRMVLFPDAFRISTSLAKTLRKVARDPAFVLRMDTAFARVMRDCSAPRPTQAGTWITPTMQGVYGAWHEEGRAHSVELWHHEQLVAGLYGVSLGAVFFGESMFTRIRDGSKIVLAYLVAFLKRHGVKLIDCQQQTPHLASLGAAAISRQRFEAHLLEWQQDPAPPWQAAELHPDGRFTPLLALPALTR